ncbi:MAG TPA: SxtJ family membrane protein [Burkholderiales bacterium]|nr:SxtJ family membrane protein [Burkholderiales bacterium]
MKDLLPMKNTLPQMKNPLPTDRSFGWTFTGVFLIVGFFLSPWAFALAAVFAVLTLTHAKTLSPLNRAWMKFGAALHHVVSPVVMGLIYFGVFTPMGVVMRAFGWDAMHRAWDPAAKSYWIRRDPPGPAEDSFKDLF